MEIQTLLVISLIVFALIMFLIFVIVRQQKTLNVLQQPKYGFLGKPIAGMVAMVIMTVGLIGGLIAINQKQISYETSASFNVSFNPANAITKRWVSTTGNQVTYIFQAQPLVDGVAYGKDSQDSFDIYWNFIGNNNVNVSESELGKTKSKPSSIDISLDKGIYKVYLIVIYKGKSYTYNEDLVV